jgi:hypothetical protein
MKRPLGVWIIGIIAVIAAVLRILTAIAALGVGGLSIAGKLGDQSGSVTGQALGIGIAMLVVGVLYLIFAFAFLGLRHWSWTAMMIIQWLSIIAVAAQFALKGYDTASLTGIILPLIIVLYLLRPKVRRAFAR